MGQQHLSFCFKIFRNELIIGLPSPLTAYHAIILQPYEFISIHGFPWMEMFPMGFGPLSWESVSVDFPLKTLTLLLAD